MAGLLGGSGSGGGGGTSDPFGFGGGGTDPQSGGQSTDPYGGGYYDPGGGFGQDPASYAGSYGNPIDAAQNAVDPGSTSYGGNQPTSDVGSGVQSGPAGPQGGGNQLAQLLQGYPNLMMSAQGQRGARQPTAPGQQTAPSWFQPSAQSSWAERGDPSQWGGPSVAQPTGWQQPSAPAPAPRTAARPAPSVPIPQPRPAAADAGDPSTSADVSLQGGGVDPGYGGSASPAAGPDEAASAGLDVSQGGPGVPTSGMLQQPNFAPYNPAQDPMGAGTSVPYSDQGGATGSWTDPGASGTWNQPYVPPSQSTFNPLNQPTGASGAGTSQPSNAITDPALMMQAGDSRTNITTDSTDPRVRAAVSAINQQGQPAAPGGSELPGGHVPSSAAAEQSPSVPAPGGSGLPGGHVPSSAAPEQPQPTGDTTTPPNAQPAVGGNYDPATGQPYPTNQGGYGQQGQGGMGQINPMKMLFDMLFGGPQALMQDLAGIVGQAGLGGLMGNQQQGGYNPANDPMGAGQSQAPWLAQGQTAPRGTNPFNYPAAPQGSRFVPGRGIVDAQGNQVQGSPGTQSGQPARPGSPATISPQSSSDSLGNTANESTSGFKSRPNEGLTNEVAANTPVSGGPSATGPLGTGVAPDQQLIAQSRIAGSDTRPTPGFSNYLRQQRAPQVQELQQNPQTKLETAAMISLEHESDPVGPIESLFNRANFYRQPIRQLLHNGFYGPINRGLLRGRMAELQRNPARLNRLYQAMATAGYGSNLLAGATDQGSVTDRNGRNPSGRVIRHGEVYNDHTPRAAQWRRAQQQAVQNELRGSGNTQVASRFGEGLNLPSTTSPRQALANSAYDRMPRWGQGVYGSFRRSGDVEDRRGEGAGATVAREIDQARPQQPGRPPMAGGYSDDPNDPMAAALGLNALGSRGPRRRYSTVGQ